MSKDQESFFANNSPADKKITALGIDPSPVLSTLETVNYLVSLGMTVLPVAPQQDPVKYPATTAVIKADETVEHRINYEPDGITPKSRFTGKNPSYLTVTGEPSYINHGNYRTVPPTQVVLEGWFVNPLTGVGALGSDNLIWIDFDVKHFESEAALDEWAIAWFEKYPQLKDTFIEKTHSGGLRVAVRVPKKPDFTNFAITPGGKHVGEALGAGRFTVLAPTIGVSGKPYINIQRKPPVEVESLESIGIFSSKKEDDGNRNGQQQKCIFDIDEMNVDAMTRGLNAPVKPGVVGNIDIERLLSKSAIEVLEGRSTIKDRSEQLTILGKELFGWENFCNDNQVGLSGSAERTIYRVGQLLGVDAARCERIIKTLNGYACEPASKFAGGELACWRKIMTVDRQTYGDKCPSPIKKEIVKEYDEFNSRRKTVDGKVVSFAKYEQQLSSQDLVSRLRELVYAGYSNIEMQAIVPELARMSVRSTRDVWNLISDLQFECEQREGMGVEINSFVKLAKYSQQPIHLHEILPKTLADALLSKAQSDHLDPIYLLQALLSATGMCLGSKTSIRAKDGCRAEDHWVEHPILWLATIAAPSSGKSNASNAVFRPLKELQKAENLRVQQAQTQLKRKESAWKRMTDAEKDAAKDTLDNPDNFREQLKARKYIFDITTPEAMLAKLADQASDAGSVWLADELGTVFKADQYKAKGGDSIEILLQTWNGPIHLSVDRVTEGKTLNFTGQSLGLYGGIQPEMATKLFNTNTDPNGFMSRLLPAVPTMPDDFDKWSNTKVDMFDCLDGLYKDLLRPSISGVNCQYAYDAQDNWQRYWEKLSRGYKQYLGTNPGFAYFLGKMKSNVNRIALILHWIENAFEVKADPYEISNDTLKRAITLADYYIGQYRLLQANSYKKGQLTDALFTIWKKALSMPNQTIKIREAQHSVTKNLRKNAVDTKLQFDAIVAAGYGQIESTRSGRSYKLTVWKEQNKEIAKANEAVDWMQQSSFKPITINDFLNADGADGKKNLFEQEDKYLISDEELAELMKVINHKSKFGDIPSDAYNYPPTPPPPSSIPTTVVSNGHNENNGKIDLGQLNQHLYQTKASEAETVIQQEINNTVANESKAEASSKVISDDTTSYVYEEETSIYIEEDDKSSTLYTVVPTSPSPTVVTTTAYEFISATTMTHSVEVIEIGDKVTTNFTGSKLKDIPLSVIKIDTNEVSKTTVTVVVDPNHTKDAYGYPLQPSQTYNYDISFINHWTPG